MVKVYITVLSTRLSVSINFNNGHARLNTKHEEGPNDGNALFSQKIKEGYPPPGSVSIIKKYL